ncbi:MAG: DegT/DnrJ/EryC1/StrS family aminotransferase [Terriglobales bacterium]
MSNQNIPFLDLITPHKELENELVAAFRAALSNAGFIGGPAVEGFEKEFAQFCDTQHSVAVNSGTDALRFALIAVGVKSGDVVVTVPNTFIATTEAVSQAGATPEFVDVDERTYNMDPAKLRAYLENGCRSEGGKLISKRSGKPVVAILPVHLYGQMADMDALLEIADKYKLIVIEDACQAHGAEYFSKRDNKWHRAGSMGVAAAFSFYPGKNLGALGEGGAVTTNNEAIARTCKMLRDHGQAKKYYHDIEGYNGRLDSIQCAFLSVKLKHLANWNEQRRAAAKRYNEGFAGNQSVVAPFEATNSKAVYHLYVVRVQNRQELQTQLGEQGIGTGIHYPVPLHEQKAYAHLGYKTGDFPVTEKVTPQIVSLPMFPNLTAEQQANVVESVKAVAQNAMATAR